MIKNDIDNAIIHTCLYRTYFLGLYIASDYFIGSIDFGCRTGLVCNFKNSVYVMCGIT